MANFTKPVGPTTPSILLSQRYLPFNNWCKPRVFKIFEIRVTVSDCPPISCTIISSYIRKKKSAFFMIFKGHASYILSCLRVHCQISLLLFVVGFLGFFFWWEKDRHTFSSSIFAWSKSSSHTPLVNFLKPKIITFLFLLLNELFNYYWIQLIGLNNLFLSIQTVIFLHSAKMGQYFYPSIILVCLFLNQI